MRHKLIAFFLIVCLLSAAPMTALAQGFDAERTGSISVTLAARGNSMPIRGAEFSLYHVATVALDGNGELRYTYTDAFAELETAPDDPALAEWLDTYIRERSVSVAKTVTDVQGRAVFADLPLGLYYLKQTNYVEGYAPCKPFLAAVPDQTDGRYSYDVKARPKTEKAKYTDISVKKVWDVEDAAKIADSVEVELLRYGLTVKTAVLSEENNWTITFSDMPESDSYSIVEVNIPEGFAAVYTSKGYEFTVTNKLSPPPDDPKDPNDPDDPAPPIDPDDPNQPGDPDDPDQPGEPGEVPSPGEDVEDSKLIQTGQLVWPIPVLAMAGLCLISIGTVVLRKTRDSNA